MFVIDPTESFCTRVRFDDKPTVSQDDIQRRDKYAKPR